MEANNNAALQTRAMQVNPANTRQPSAPRAQTPAAEPAAPRPAQNSSIPSAGIALELSQAVELGRPISFSDRDIPESRIAEYVNQVNVALEPSFFRLNHSVHEATNMVMVQVIDRHSDEILREIPSESRLDVIAKMLEFAGILFDETG
jgi:flagellar protein FlaG